MSFDFDELKHKAGNMLEKGKEKAHEAAESEKGQKIKSKAGELFEKGKEKAHEFAESETGKKVKNKAEKLLATAGNIYRNKQVHLFKYTVTESHSQLFNYPQVKLLDLFQAVLRNRIHLKGLFEKCVKVLKAQVHWRRISSSPIISSISI